MNPAAKARGASAVAATIQAAEGGGFIAIASDDQLDRDGERILGGALAPLPDSIPINLGHTMSPSDTIARGRPYYDLDRLMVDATFASTRDAQEVRQKVADGVLDSRSIVFIGKQWETIDGVRTCVRGELLGADIVAIPSNSRARVLSVRGLSVTQQARQVANQTLVDLARLEVADAKTLLRRTDTPSDIARRLLKEL